MGHASIEVADPEKFADFLIEFAEDPECNVARLAEACGLPKGTARHIADRLRTRYLPVTEKIKEFTTASLLEKIESKLPMLLDGITQEKVTDSALREIAVAFGVLAEKRQLLKGEPTQILSHAERQNLNELLPSLVHEAKRRGITIDVDYEEVPNVTLTPATQTRDDNKQRKRDAKNRR